MPLITVAGPGSRLYVAEDVPPAGDANPHGYDDATVIWRSTDYPTNDATEIFQLGSDDLATWTWQDGGGYDGLDAWRVELGVNTATGEGPESQSGHGLKWWDGAGSSADTYPIAFVSSLVRFSSQFLTVGYDDEPQLNKSKLLDIHGYNSAGTASDSATRQLMQLNIVPFSDSTSFGPLGQNCPLGVYLSLTNGGAGGRWTFDGVNTPVDLRDYADQWIWVGWLGDIPGRRSIIYVKAPGEDLQTSVIRTSTDECSFAGTYAYADRGWAMPGLYNSHWFAYWQENRAIHTPKPSIDFARMRSGNGWIAPPF